MNQTVTRAAAALGIVLTFAAAAPQAMAQGVGSTASSAVTTGAAATAGAPGGGSSGGNGYVDPTSAGLVTGPASWSVPGDSSGSPALSMTLPQGWQADSKSPFPFFIVPGSAPSQVNGVGMVFCSPTNGQTVDKLVSNGGAAFSKPDFLQPGGTYAQTSASVRNQSGFAWDGALTFPNGPVTIGDGMTANFPLSGAGFMHAVGWQETDKIGCLVEFVAAPADQASFANRVNDLNGMITSLKVGS